MYSFLLAIFSCFDIVMHFESGSCHSESSLKDKEAESFEHALHYIGIFNISVCVVGVDTVDALSETPQSEVQDSLSTSLITSTPSQNGGIATNHK
jgi:hypothetical protein